MTAGAADGPHAPFLPTDPGGPSSFHMTAAVTGAAQRLAAGRAHPWTAAAAAYCWEHLPRDAGSAYEIRYALDFLDGAEDRGRADAALEALRPFVPPDRPLPVSGGTADEALPLTVLTPRPGPPDPRAVRPRRGRAGARRGRGGAARGRRLGLRLAALGRGAWPARRAAASPSTRSRCCARTAGSVPAHRRAAAPVREAGRAARAVLRPRLRLRPHAGHGPARPRPVVGRAAARHARARIDLVGVGGVRVADERGRQPPLGGAARDLRLDDRDADRLARRAGRVRGRRAALRAGLPRGAADAHRAVRGRHGARRRAPGRPRARRHGHARADAADRRRPARRDRPDRRVDRRAGDRLRRRRRCAGSAAGGSRPATSPSATA